MNQLEDYLYVMRKLLRSKGIKLVPVVLGDEFAQCRISKATYLDFISTLGKALKLKPADKPFLIRVDEVILAFKSGKVDILLRTRKGYVISVILSTQEAKGRYNAY